MFAPVVSSLLSVITTSWLADGDRVAFIEIITEFILGKDAKVMMAFRFQIGKDEGTVA